MSKSENKQVKQIKIDHDIISSGSPSKLDQKDESTGQLSKLADSINETKRSMLDTLLAVNKNNMIADSQKNEINNLNVQLFAQSDAIINLETRIDELTTQLKWTRETAIKRVNTYDAMIPMSEEECRGVTLRR